MPKKPKLPKLRLGDVIRFHEDNYTDIGLPQPFRHSAWIVMRIDTSPIDYADYYIRVRPASGGLAMTAWIYVYDYEFMIDPFLSAVFHAQKKALRNHVFMVKSSRKQNQR